MELENYTEPETSHLGDTEPKGQVTKGSDDLAPQKARKIIVACIILVVVIVGVAFIIHESIKLSSPISTTTESDAFAEKNQSEQSGSNIPSEEKKSEEPKPSEATTSPDNASPTNDADIDDLVEDILLAMKEKFPDIYFYTTAGPSTIRLKEKPIFTASTSGYGFEMARTTDSSLAEKVRTEGFDYVKNTIMDKGFIPLNWPDETMNSSFYQEANDIFCTTQDSYPFYFRCTKGSWIDENDKALVLELSESLPNASYISAKTSDIKDSPVSPYQKLNTGVLSAVALFYRISPESEWKHFATTQMILRCKDYDGEAAKAFAGEKCLESEQPWVEGTVQPQNE